VKLRNQLLTLSLATLLVPWFGWKLVQELERFLRAGHESALLASARTVSRALPGEFQSELLFGRERILAMRQLSPPPHLDGYADDWPAADKALEFRSPDGKLQLAILAGQSGSQLYLYCSVRDASPVRDAAPSEEGVRSISDGLVLHLRTARGLASFRIHTAAPGRLLLSSLSEGDGQLEGYWLDRPDGYDVELSLPMSPGLVDLGIGAQDAEAAFGGAVVAREAGTLENGLPANWLTLTPRDGPLGDWLAGVIPAAHRAWVLDAGGWVLADSGPAALPAERELSFAERLLYRVVAGARTELLPERAEQVVRFDEALAATALAGDSARHWGQDPDSALVRNTVAVPIEIEGGIHGAVILEANTDGMLLVTNRALGRLLLSTLLLTVVLVAGLWFFATRLSRRVQRLSGAVSEAMDDRGVIRALPLTEDRDELGELARNNARLLRAVAGYTQYLQKLAGRLSHELKTPLAITRSSLDNLASQELGEEAARYLQRAREGLERQAAIVRAMSEANRLEAAVKAADWEEADLAGIVAACVEAYRGVHPGRDIRFDPAAAHCRCRCAPDLLAQALDKLVENAVSLTTAQDEICLGLECGAEQARLSVRNTGSRLPDVPEDQLFDSLVSLREAGGGHHLGLGLHIVKLVAEAHGGAVSARNLDDAAGVEFQILLPRH
jgi:signal transduction histidine kinase